MLRLHVIGNLGADARLQGEKDQRFVSITIASTRRVKREDGNTEEITTWVQATINGECEALFPYLVKGQTVSVFGDCSVNVYHSEKERRMIAGIRVFVRDIELVGGRPDEIPRNLYDEKGVAYKVSKYFNCPSNNHARLYDRNGEAYDIDQNGWVSKFQVAQQDTQAESSQEPAAEPSETESKKSDKSKKK